MTRRDPFWSSSVIRSAILAAVGSLAVAAMGAAINVRDHVAETAARLDKDEAVQAERDARILADLAAIKLKLGVTP